jgi:hypothetical protein
MVRHVLGKYIALHRVGETYGSGLLEKCQQLCGQRGEAGTFVWVNVAAHVYDVRNGLGQEKP